MRNPLAKPLTTGQWLLSSICWMVVGAGGWLLLVVGLPGMPGPDAELLLWLYFASAVAAHLLIWRKAVTGGYFWLAHSTSIWLYVITNSWLMLLALLQAFILLALLAALSFIVSPNSGGSWLTF